MVVAMAAMVMCFRPGAADEGVQPLHPVHQPLLLQEVERPVDRGRRGTRPLRAQPVEQRIGADRLDGGEHQAQHLAAQLGELGPPARAGARRLVQRGVDRRIRCRIRRSLASASRRRARLRHARPFRPASPG
jgi:hypothetical protein